MSADTPSTEPTGNTEATGSAEASEPTGNTGAAGPLVIRISPMAHLAIAFFALGLLVPVLSWPATAPILLVPVLLSVWIIRLRTVADVDGVTTRTLTGGRRLRWAEIDGLRFTKSSWARAHLTDGDEVVLPAVTFVTLPQLTEISGGRVPNPYR